MLRMKLMAGVAFAALLAACNPQSGQTGPEADDDVNSAISNNNLRSSDISDNSVGGSAADRWAETGTSPANPANGGAIADPGNDDYAAGDYAADYAGDSNVNYDNYPASGDLGYDDSNYVGNYYPDTAYDDFDYDSRYYEDYDRYGNDVDYDYFYDALSPHGEWFYHPRWGYVWAPARVGNNFRPYYSAGHWQDTYEFGWT